MTTGLRSMTGFASATGSFDSWSFAVDLRAVNGRGLDLRLRVPDWIDGLEAGARKLLQGKIARGSVTLSIRVSRDETMGAARINADVLRAALGALSQIEAAAEKAGLTLRESSAAEIASLRGVLETGDDMTPETGKLSEAILGTLHQVAEAFDVDRAREGTALADILAAQIDEIARLTAQASDTLGDRAAAQRSALERNLGRLLDAKEIPDEARLLQELALIAVKSDVTEEIDRLAAHVAAARALLSDTGPVGRKLDFLMQEFNREANTLCSKAGSAALTAIGLDLKTVIDQMREQVQNVE